MSPRPRPRHHRHHGHQPLPPRLCPHARGLQLRVRRETEEAVLRVDLLHHEHAVHHDAVLEGGHHHGGLHLGPQEESAGVQARRGRE